MIARITGAVLRALLVAILIAMPSLVLPGTGQDMAETTMLIALFGAALVGFEYGSAYPCLIEFRAAPPFNRIRFAALFVTVLMLSLVAAAPGGGGGPLTEFLRMLGTRLADLADFEFSPVRLVVLMLAPDASNMALEVLRISAALAHLVAAISLLAFAVAIKLTGWPLRGGSFNVWVNLPTFDPTVGGDVVARLRRDGRINLALGILLPFLMPAAVGSAGNLFGGMTLENPQTMIWAVAAWAFLPASLLMRGIAMIRIAAMITAKRRSTAELEPGLVAV